MDQSEDKKTLISWDDLYTYWENIPIIKEVDMARVLVTDDALFMRKMLSDILKKE